jgi:Methane oxygenase PmoA
MRHQPNRKAAVIALVSALCAAAAPVELKRGQKEIEVIVAGKPFTTYFFANGASKPYLMPLTTPSGIVITRPFPVANDIGNASPKNPSFEPHQRPLYFGHGDIDGLDFWGEQAFDRYYDDHARQAYGHMDLKTVDTAGPGTVRTRFSLLDPNQRVIGEETQSFTFSGDDTTRTIDCEFIIHATAGPVVMGDTKEGTFGIRLNSELSAPHDHMVNSRGGHGEREIWGKPAEWVNYSGTVTGKPVGIAVFDSPSSFRHPTTWHARAYGLVAANQFGWREFTKDKSKDGSWTIQQGESLAFRYRVLIYDGEMMPARLDEMYRQYAAGK